MLCLCSLAKSKTTIVLVDDKRLRTPACRSLHNAVSRAEVTIRKVYMLSNYVWINTNGVMGMFGEEAVTV
jgi:hypothetical protein